jgi:hypothetical protein
MFIWNFYRPLHLGWIASLVLSEIKGLDHGYLTWEIPERPTIGYD